MNKDKSRIIISVLVVIILILVGLILLFSIGMIDFKGNDTKSNLSNQEIMKEGDASKIDSSTKQVEENNSEEIDSNSFIRETRVTLVEEPGCTGSNGSLTASIQPDGNILIAQNRGAVDIEVGNAKYLFKMTFIACDNVKLYFITEDSELYVIDHPDAGDLNQKFTKVTESKVKEFLGVGETKSDLKVLLENGQIEYIKCFSLDN